MKLFVAARNSKKLAELDRILRTTGIDSVELLSLSDIPEYPERPETSCIFADNAYIEASDDTTHTGYACLTDDSGSSVNELNGTPGVLSVRWSGTHDNDIANYELLLAQMGDRPGECRTASFRIAYALVIPGVKEVPSALIDGDFPTIFDGAGNLPLVVEGRWPGSIPREPVGDNGFGYDPVSAPAAGEGNETEGTLSMAQMSAGDKDAFSYRERALRALAPMLKILAEAKAKG